MDPVACLKADQVYWNCPGCNYMHTVRVNLADPQAKIPSCWEWNSSLTLPTFSPSILTRGMISCHCYVKNGQIEFLSDCEHDLKGQTVQMKPWDENWD